MDLAKYLSLLQTGTLFFCRLDRLSDPFEGSLSRASTEEQRSKFDAVLRSIPGVQTQGVPDMVEGLRKQATDWNLGTRKWTAINCWHISEHESAAMWDIYAKAGAGVAVKSTFGGLQAGLAASTETIWAGRVRYFDYSTETLPSGNAYWKLVSKRKSFEHEAELRAVIHDRPTGQPDFNTSCWEVGLSVPVRLDQLVNAVFVAPTAPSWFADIVQNVTSRYQFSWSVSQSSLLDAPLF